jgi:hypothetical protein
VTGVGRSLTGLGLAVVAAGVAVLVQPSLATPVTTALAAVGNAYLVVAAVSAVAFFVAVGRWLTWSLRGVEEAAMPAVESFRPMPAPGAELDEAVPELAGRRGRAARPVDHEDAIRERLREDAVETLVVQADLAPGTAREQVDAGTWTDDHFAAQFLGGEEAPRPRPHRRLLAWLSRERDVERNVRHAVDAIEEVAT